MWGILVRREMEYIYEVYKEKSFSRAAENLFISQPALSAIVKKAEEKLQVPIFDRSCKPIKLTEAGRLYIRSTERIMDIERDLEDNINALRDSVKSIINIGSAAFFCAHVLPEIIQTFQRRYPDYRVNLSEGNAVGLANSLQSGLLDLILDVEALDQKIFTSVPWKREHIVLAVPAAFEVNTKLEKYHIPFSAVRSGEFRSDLYMAAPLALFRRESFLFLKKGNDMYRRALKMCKDAGFTPKISMYLDQLLTSYYVAKDGGGIAFVRASITQYVEPADKLLFYKIADENSLRDIMISRKKNSEISKAEALFIDFLQSNA